MELARARELDLAREPAPVAGVAVGTVDDLAERLRRHVAAEVDTFVAEAANDREMLRREIDEEGAALVRAGPVPLGEGEQLVGHDDARDDPAAKGARSRA